MLNIEKILKSAVQVQIGNNAKHTLRFNDGSLTVVPSALRFNPDVGQWSVSSQHHEKIPVRFFDSSENELFAHEFYSNLNDVLEDNLSCITYDALCVQLKGKVLKYNDRYYTAEFKSDCIKIMNDSNCYRIRKGSTNFYVDNGELVIFNGVLEPRYFEIHSTINEGIKL